MTTAHLWISDGSPIEDPFGYGERAVEFLRRLRHPKSRARGHAFELDPWQERIVRRIYGPRHDDGRRVVETVVLLLPRGNRKTSLAAALSLLHVIGPERVPGGEVLFAASDKKQAAIGFREALGIVRSDPRVAKAVRVSDAVNSTKRIVFNRDGTFLETLSSDAGTQHGRTPTFALIDELHAWPKRDLWDAIRSGLPKTPGALLVIATTAGRGQENLAFEIVDYARKVARGEIDNPSFLPILFETPADAEWQDEAVWHLANPGLAHGYPSIEGLRQLAREAKDRPGDRDVFRQLHLNTWLDYRATPWLMMDIYDEGADPPLDLAEREGEPAWIGVDLGSTSDLTAVVAALRDDDGGYTLFPFAFAPEASLRRRQDRGEAPYSRWAEEGFLIATPGDVTDWDRVETFIRDLCQRLDVREIAMDPWGARTMMARLMEDDLPVVEHRQGFISMSGPMKAFERAALARKLRHGGHPVFRWCVENVVADMDPAGNVKPNKSKAREKIDVAVAAIMALGRAEANETTTSIYDDTNERPDGLLIF